MPGGGHLFRVKLLVGFGHRVRSDQHSPEKNCRVGARARDGDESNLAQRVFYSPGKRMFEGSPDNKNGNTVRDRKCSF